MSGRRRLSSLLPLAVLVAGGCRVDPTSLMVTVRFDDTRHQPQRLDVSVTLGGSTVRMNTPISAPDRPVRDGDSFLVLIPDRYEGLTATIAVTTVEPNRPPLSASGAVKVRLHEVTPLSIPLDGTGVDGGSDGAPSQLTCATPLDVSGGNSFSGNSATAPGSGTGSCGGGTGVDIVASTMLGAWTTLTLDTSGSSYDTLLYTRLTCADPASELPVAGPCAGAAVGFGTACSDDASGLGNAARLVHCGLPPGRYSTWLDGRGPGGPWQLNVTRTPVSLNSCAEAGNLLAGGTFAATTTGHTNAFATTMTSCGSDGGASSPDAVFFLATTATHDLTFRAQLPSRGILYVRASCGGPDLACDVANRNPEVTLMNQPPGIYYVIVDGDSGGLGNFTITATVN